MPKTPRDVSHDRMVRFLQRHGWTVAREGGRHTVMARQGAQLSIPRHTRLKTGTINAILKQAGVEREALDEL